MPTKFYLKTISESEVPCSKVSYNSNAELGSILNLVTSIQTERNKKLLQCAMALHRLNSNLKPIKPTNPLKVTLMSKCPLHAPTFSCLLFVICIQINLNNTMNSLAMFSSHFITVLYSIQMNTILLPQPLQYFSNDSRALPIAFWLFHLISIATYLLVTG